MNFARCVFCMQNYTFSFIVHHKHNVPNLKRQVQDIPKKESATLRLNKCKRKCLRKRNNIAKFEIRCIYVDDEAV